MQLLKRASLRAIGCWRQLGALSRWLICRNDMVIRSSSSRWMLPTKCQEAVRDGVAGVRQPRHQDGGAEGLIDGGTCRQKRLITDRAIDPFRGERHHEV